MITVLFINKYFNNPLHLFGFIGFIMLSLGFCINAKLTYDWFFNAVWINPYKNPLFFLGILLIIVGIQLFSTGLIGELMVYLNRKKDYTYDNVDFHNFD